MPFTPIFDLLLELIILGLWVGLAVIIIVGVPIIAYFLIFYPIRILWRLFHKMGLLTAISDIQEQDKAEDIIESAHPNLECYDWKDATK